MSATGAGRSVRTMVSACAAAAVIWTPGCSYVFVQEVPARHRSLRHFECTSTRIPPVLDTVGGGAFAISAVSNTVSPQGHNDADSNLLAIGAALIGTTAFAFSAVYGYVHTAECDEAKQALVERIARETPPAPALTGAARGCAADIECKGNRICVEHACVDPMPAPVTVPAPTPQTVPAPQAEPPAPATAPTAGPEAVPGPTPAAPPTTPETGTAVPPPR